MTDELSEPTQSDDKVYDLELIRFAATGAMPLPVPDLEDRLSHEGALIWYASFGSGPPVILLHGGLGNSGNWGYQVPALLDEGYRVIVIDSRGHGRSTRDARPFQYEGMAGDVLAVMNALHLAGAALLGWSDGAVISLMVARRAPERVAGVFFFGCNVDPSGTRDDFEITPPVERCLQRHVKDYSELSATPEEFASFAAAVRLMQETQPNLSESDLAGIDVPVAIVQAENDEFIRPEHARYLARSIPNADFIFLKGLSHFAPVQRPAEFNAAMLTFLEERRVRERLSQVPHSDLMA